MGRPAGRRLPGRADHDRLPDPRQGHRDRLGVHPGRQAEGQTEGTVTGADFARALWGIWLGDRPSNRELKKGLLGGAGAYPGPVRARVSLKRRDDAFAGPFQSTRCRATTAELSPL